MIKSFYLSHRLTLWTRLLPIFALAFLLTLSDFRGSIAGLCKCIRATDYDTITVTSNSSKQRSRLVGVDAPETSKGKNQPGQPFSQKSTKYLAALVLNKYVEIISYGTDRYDRILGAVYVGGKNVNLEMVKAGLAEVYRGKPTSRFDNRPYQKAEKAAR